MDVVDGGLVAKIRLPRRRHMMCPSICTPQYSTLQGLLQQLRNAAILSTLVFWPQWPFALCPIVFICSFSRMHASHQEMHELDIRLMIRTACKAKRYTSIEGPGFEQYLVFLTTFGPPGCAAARACPYECLCRKHWNPASSLRKPSHYSTGHSSHHLSNCKTRSNDTPS